MIFEYQIEKKLLNFASFKRIKAFRRCSGNLLKAETLFKKYLFKACRSDSVGSKRLIETTNKTWGIYLNFVKRKTIQAITWN